MALGEVEAALASFDKGLELEPNAIEIRKSRVEALQTAGRTDDARVEERRIAKLQSESSKLGPNGGSALTLGKLQWWAAAKGGEAVLSGEELAVLHRRTDAACDRFGWLDIGKKFDQRGERDQCRNLAFLMLRKEMTFGLAAFEYTAALESGTRILASDDVLEGAYTDMTFAIRRWAEVGN